MDKLVFILPVASCIYLLIACVWVREFFVSKRNLQFPADFAPPVSILKPVKGVDAGAYENFASFCQLDYPRYEILFGVADPNDPVVSVIERLKDDFPHIQMRLLAGIPQRLPNPKASTLSVLSKEAAYDILVISDSDIRVKPEYLRKVVSPLVDPSVGLVTCAYRGVSPITLTAKLEALYMGLTFLPEVVVARRFLDMRFALGATMAIRKQDLEKVGSWDASGHYLAEDSRVAVLVAESGKKVLLSHYICDTYLGSTTWDEQWHREVRWARTNRVNRPREYPGIILTFAIPLAVVLLPVAPRSVVSWAIVAATLLVRLLTAWLIAGYTESRFLRRMLYLLPLRDFLSALVWCAGLGGRKVKWRGQTLRLAKDGRILSSTN
ncbi:MAG: bacteriohopanetetrol glucosamine biosynthesis glycosyltransferase HpnI [Thermoleophilia bacterium]|nr:bacteriohopanetetrol glucosamine biosynthesis glycosyltransferase HpnI [Thermoleophilia bacterium]